MGVLRIAPMKFRFAAREFRKDAAWRDRGLLLSVNNRQPIDLKGFVGPTR